MKYLNALFLTALLSSFTLPAFCDDTSHTNNAVTETPNDNSPATKKTIYTFVDDSGRTIFTDDPTSSQAKNAKALEARNTNTLPAVEVPKKTKTKTKRSEKKSPIYESLALLEVGDEWDYQLHVEVSPDLREGDSFQVILDGEDSGITSQTPLITAPEMEQGVPHTLQVNIVDGDNEVISSSNTISLNVEQVGTMPGGFKRRVERVDKAIKMGIKTGY